MVSAPSSSTIDQARELLRDAAVKFAAVHHGAGEASALRELEAAAREFAKVQIEAAAGVTAAKHQAKRDERRGVQLCSNCAIAVVPARAAGPGGGMMWLDARTHQPHRCGSGR